MTVHHANRITKVLMINSGNPNEDKDAELEGIGEEV